MDRLTQLRAEPGGSRDSTLDSSATTNEAYMTANDSSKYFSLSEESSFDTSPIKDVTLAPAVSDSTEKITAERDRLISNLSPIGKTNELLDSYKIGKHIEAANILSGGVDIFDDNDNSYDGNELVIDDGADNEEKANLEVKLVSKESQDVGEPVLIDGDGAIPSKDTEVVLQIDGKNVDAIDIGNGLYLYRREGEQEELAAVQIVDNDQQPGSPSFKFLKVRENAEGNLEVYEEIEVEVPKEMPSNETQKTSKLPIKKMISESSKVSEGKKPSSATTAAPKIELKNPEADKIPPESKSGLNFNGKSMKFNEARKSPLIGSFTPMTFHSTPNKEGIPLTKTIVDQQLHPNRHSNNTKKKIEVNTESCKQKHLETPIKNDASAVETISETESCKIINECDSEKNDFNIVKDNANDKIKVPNTDNSTQSDLKADNTKECLKTPIEKIENKVNSSEISSTTVEKNVAIEAKSESLLSDGSKIEENEILKESVTPLVIEKSSCTKYALESNIPKEELPSSSNVKENDTSAITTTTEVSVTEKEEKKIVVLRKEMNITEVVETKEMEKTTIIPKLNEIVEPVQSNKICDTVAKNEGENSIKHPNKMNEDKVQKHLSEIKDTEKSTSVSKLPIEVICTTNNSEIQKKNIATESNSNNLINFKDLGIKVPNKIEEPEIESNPDVPKTDNKSKLAIVESKVPKTTNISKHLETGSGIKKPGANDVNIVITASTVVSHKPNSSVKVETKPNASAVNVIDNDFVNKQVHKALIIKNVTSSSTETAKIKEKAKIFDTISTSSIAVRPVESSSSVTATKCDQIGASDKKDIPKIQTPTDTKPKSINNNAVPFGKWTEANKQEYLIKIKETKVTSNNTNQIKQTNDLNRRDVLKKIDTQRQISNLAAAKTQEMTSKHTAKTESTTFGSKAPVKQETKPPLPRSRVEPIKVQPKHSIVPISQPEVISAPSSATADAKADAGRIPNNQTLIDKTIESYLLDRKPIVKFNLESAKRLNAIREKSNDKVTSSYQKYYLNKEKNASILNDIEMKMNELHGIPFTERPSHDLPQRYGEDVNSYSMSDSASKELPLNKGISLISSPDKLQLSKSLKTNEEFDLSDDEQIIEHEPITGDIDSSKKRVIPYASPKDKLAQTVTSNQAAVAKKDSVITETEFDKFARRNSITYENCITVNFDAKKHNVVQTIVEKDNLPNKNPKSLPVDVMLPSDILPISDANKPQPNASRFVPMSAEDSYNKSKYQIAYQSAMSAKLHQKSSIAVLEDKPVKVVFMDTNVEFVANKLNVQGKDLSPARKYKDETSTLSSCDSLDSDLIDSVDESKSQDSFKKAKHQRKQVLTPVETPEMELIEANDLGITLSPKKKRKIEDANKIFPEKSIIPKKTYLLSRSTESVAASAIDSLVKAAELLENQEGKSNSSIDVESQNSPQTPVKRGRGRPRKHPLPEGISPPAASPVDKNKLLSPRKKPRLERKISKHETSSDDDSMEEGIIRENWTMGKINENIVCPICSKLFRSENVVFKHVKHCTGPSPNRSDSGDKRSPRRGRKSQETDNKSYYSQSDMESDSDEEVLSLKKNNISKIEKKMDEEKLATSKPSEEIIVIEDTPVKPKIDKPETSSIKSNDTQKMLNKPKFQPKTNNLVCEFCGKTFRQLSYLVSHKMQHKADEFKKTEQQTASNKPSVFSCEVCKKEFRKLHHLVQHRIIHNPPNLSTKLRRKSSVEQSDSKIANATEQLKTSDDQSAGFRCEPCDKSFRKLHHLVEHRETHDGINRQKITTTAEKVAIPADKQTTAPPQCDVCKKTFRKLHHLIEHKEQHAEVNSEKSDDKSVRSSLSTKDIIHECSLCYMVFPNEHSLNKHSVNCQKKKRQSSTKQTKPDVEEDQNSQESIETIDSGSVEEPSSPKVVEIEKELEKVEPADKVIPTEANETPKVVETVEEKQKLEEKEPAKIEPIKETPKEPIGDNHVELKPDEKPNSSDKNDNETPKTKKTAAKQPVPATVTKTTKTEVVVTRDTPKRKQSSRDKIANTVTKRQKITPFPLPNIDENKQPSDEDEVRYMLNPNFETDDNSDGKLFMKVRANKRSSLQIERPNSKDLVKRRTSLQHPPKVPRLKPKLERKASTTKQSEDSDDSSIKYSFPKPSDEKPVGKQEAKEPEKKVPRKSLADRRKSLVGLAKRKSLGKAASHSKVMAAPVKDTVKKRTTDVGHRCDCGQLFNSGALLARHTTLAHTPPRIRRRRSPLPDLIPKQTKDKPSNPRKSSVTDKTPKQKPSASKDSVDTKSSVKVRKSTAHRGVPVPEKMRKLMEKLKK